MEAGVTPGLCHSWSTQKENGMSTKWIKRIEKRAKKARKELRDAINIVDDKVSSFNGDALNVANEVIETANAIQEALRAIDKAFAYAATMKRAARKLKTSVDEVFPKLTVGEATKEVERRGRGQRK